MTTTTSRVSYKIFFSWEGAERVTEQKMSWSPYKLWLPVAIAGDIDSGSLHPEHDLSESHLLLLERTEGKEGVGREDRRKGKDKSF